ncbi:substrate-binding domain-containing protein [Algirhabdus cladophorae]|uniref:substrate-binding domain-containing protein n=1 Tax=Algirhabdus cladophorae TaxID=3377108 RepID=UPI003B8462C3
MMDTQTINIVLPVALKEVFDEIVPSFIAQTGHRFAVALMLNPEVPGYVKTGADWSIALSNPSYIQTIVDDNRCNKDGLQVLGHSPLCLAMRGDSTTAPSQDPAAIAAFLAQADSIAITDSGTSGAQFSKLAAQLDIAQKIQGKLRWMPGGGPMAALQSGDVQVAALPLTNVAPVHGVHAKFICPLQMDVHIDLALCVATQANAATLDFAAWLQQPSLQKRLHSLGLHTRIVQNQPDPA